jgi:hypothetical protein
MALGSATHGKPLRGGMNASEGRAAAGPDFAGYHAKSDFSEPHVHGLDKGGSTILTAFDEMRASIWRNGRKPHGQAVSRTWR